MLPPRLHSGVLYLASPNRMFPSTTDPVDKLKADALERRVERQKEEAMSNLPTDLEVLPSSLLLEQMEREAAQRQRVREGCFVPPPQLRRVNSRWAGEEVVSLPAHVRDAASKLAPLSATAISPRLAAASKPASSSATALSPRLPAASIPGSSSATTKFPRLTAAPPIQSSVRWSEATPEELEERLRFFARQIKRFKKTSFLCFSPEQMQRIKQMEEDYETAVRLFYCCPPSPTPSHKSSAAAAVEQPMSGLRSAAAAVEQPTSGLQNAAAAVEQPTSGLQSAAAAAVEQPTSGLQHAAEFPEGPLGGLPPRPGPAHLLFFLWGVLMELRPDTPQPDYRPDTPQPDSRPDTPQPGMTPDPKSASTSSTRRRGRRKRDASAHATEGLCDASVPTQATEGLCDASASAHVTEGSADASAPAPSLQAFQGFSEKLVLILASEPWDEVFGEEAPPDPVSEGFKEQLVLVLASEPCNEGFEEEAPPDPVLEGFKKQFVLVLASEPRDEGSPGADSASEGSPGSASVSEGTPGSQPVYEAPGSQPFYEALAHWRPPELCACWGRPPGRPPELCACWGRPPGRPPELCACWGRPPGRPPELCFCFWPSYRGRQRPPCRLKHEEGTHLLGQPSGVFKFTRELADGLRLGYASFDVLYQTDFQVFKLFGDGQCKPTCEFQLLQRSAPSVVLAGNGSSALASVGCDRQDQLHSCFASGLIKDKVDRQLEPRRRRKIVYSPIVSGSDPEDPDLDYSCLMSCVQVLR
ncbi:hypothetical protein CRENBAI_012719 [Crenichthys baileyi]|uniref:Uncharacterized protein n=1 Tax=Crenichthys baileyi TaxID=28760 RepID=A0AAV9RYI3_9TELE